MSVLADYRNDCFVSYSHLDDSPFGDPPRPGWVAFFHSNLEVFVNAHVGRRVRIWRDKRLTGSEVFSDEIEDQLRGSAVLISVISPGYLNSVWCSRELIGFTKRASETNSLRVGNLHRVVKVMRLPVDRNALPHALDDVLGAHFYNLDQQSQVARDLLLDPGGDRAYLARVDDVAQAVKKLLDAMSAGVQHLPPPEVPAETDLRTVFLAWTTSDLVDQRERLRRDLEARDFRVVPSGAPPLQADRLKEVVRESLRAADLAIHLVGTHYGFVPEGDERSVIELQGDDAVYRDVGSRAARIFWLAESAGDRDPRLSAMLKRAQEAGGASVDVMAAKSIEDLKTRAIDRLDQATRPRTAAIKASRRTVYLICDQLDRAAVAPVQQHLFKWFEVRLPLFSDNVTDMREEHEASLKECDGVLIHWGRGTEAWLRKTLRDLRRAFGMTPEPRTEPYLATCLYIAGPPDDAKANFLTHEMPVVQAGDGRPADGLRSFVESLGEPVQ